jgi:putative cardiolipin synthase
VLGVGPIARQASGIFDHFWNSEWVASASVLDDDTTEGKLRRAHEALLEKLHQASRLKSFGVDRQDWSTTLRTLPDTLIPGTSHVLHDTVTDSEVGHTMSEPMAALADLAEEEILISNAYLIPTESGIARLRTPTKDGVRIGVLTNSLASLDVALVNSRYGVWRKALVEAGVSLHEMRPDAAIKNGVVDTPPVVSEYMGLHSKAVVVDRRKVFVGSMNFDPRSADINTEMGVIIDSPVLAEQLALIMERDMSEDPATGSAAAALGAYLRAQWPARLPFDLAVHQGVAMGRASLLRVAVTADALRLSGAAVPVIEGHIWV